MERNMLNLVFVGHVDHGKSTLIGRLLMDTGTLPEGKVEELQAVCRAAGKDFRLAFLMDQFEEERTHDMTIDTTQTFFRTPTREYVIIDAPGHREFIKNMITGASQAHAAILIVSAKEGIQDQTRRHGYLLHLLGIRQLVVVINKMDLLNYDEAVFQSVSGDVSTLMDQVQLKPINVIPISAEQGDNVASSSSRMQWYNGPPFLKALDSLAAPLPDTDKPMRFPVQDVYQIDGQQVLVGRVESGRLQAGAKVKTMPSDLAASVNGIHVFGRPRDSTLEAIPGQSIGISTSPVLDIRRGEIVSDLDQLPAVTQECRAKIFWLASEARKVGDRLAMRCSTQEVPCRIERIDHRFDCSNLENVQENAEQINMTDIGEVVISTERPIVLERFEDIPELGRFTLVEGENVMAGGIVIDTRLK